MHRGVVIEQTDCIDRKRTAPGPEVRTRGVFFSDQQQSEISEILLIFDDIGIHDFSKEGNVGIFICPCGVAVHIPGVH